MTIDKKGIPAFFTRRAVGFSSFAFLTLYGWLFVNNGALWSVNPVTYSLYALDYSMGFCTRILPGAVYHALIGKYEYGAVSAFVTVFYLLLAALVSFFADRFFAAAPAREKKTCLFLLFLFLSGPFTFGIEIREFGMLDLYWLLFFAAGVLLLPNKRLKWLLPLCFAGMIFIHFAALFCYAATLLALILFFAAKAEDRREKRQYYALLGVCFLLTVGLSGYFIQFESENAVYPVEQFNAILRERGVIYPEYLDSTLYRMTDSSIATPVYAHERYTVDPDSAGLTRFVQWILYYAWAAVSFPQQYARLWFLFLLELPLAALLIGLLLSYGRLKKGNGALRLTVLVMLLLFFGTTAVGFLFSSDTFRWIAHAVTGLFAGCFTALYYDWREGFAKARRMIKRASVPAALVYAFVYALVSMDPYS